MLWASCTGSSAASIDVSDVIMDALKRQATKAGNKCSYSRTGRISRRRRRFQDLGAEMVADRPLKLRIPIIKALADVYI
jgi:hypothetical protein